MEQHKFNIGDVVYIQGSDRPWFVIGVAMRPCYDLIAWEYRIGQAVYGEHPMSAFGSRCDVNTRDNMWEEKLIPESEWLEMKKKELQQKIEETEKQLSELKQKQQVEIEKTEAKIRGMQEKLKMN